MIISVYVCDDFPQVIDICGITIMLCCKCDSIIIAGPAGDFNTVSVTVTFSSEATNGTLQCVVITILNDNIREDIEEFTLTLSSESRIVTVTDSTATIMNQITDICKNFTVMQQKICSVYCSV